MRSGSRCPAFYGEIPPMRWGILNDDGGYFYCITYSGIPLGIITDSTQLSPEEVRQIAKDNGLAF